MAYTLEVCTATVGSIKAAVTGGANRIELCSALSEGGLTPSMGFISEAVESGIATHVLIRPRNGDFYYSEDEIRVMEVDVKMAKLMGVQGVVIGGLTAEGDIDEEMCKRLVAAADGINVTFHRAFDMCRDPQAALEQIISLGCNRLLTSGLAATAKEGIPVIKQMVEQAAGRIVIMPGCGVNANNALEILTATGAQEIHASASHLLPSAMTYRQAGVNMGAAGVDEYAHKCTSEEAVRAIVSAING